MRWLLFSLCFIFITHATQASNITATKQYFNEVSKAEETFRITAIRAQTLRIEKNKINKSLELINQLICKNFRVPEDVFSKFIHDEVTDINNILAENIDEMKWKVVIFFYDSVNEQVIIKAAIYEDVTGFFDNSLNK